VLDPCEGAAVDDVHDSGAAASPGLSSAGSPLAESDEPAEAEPLVVTRHRDDIQGLRAIAVLLVVLGHAGVEFLKGGYVGVDVFFVLSGFLITGILLAGADKRGHVSLSDFYTRRARRILPAAVLTLVATDIAAHHLLNLIRARQAVTDSIWASVFAANIRFADQGTDYFARGQPPSPIQHFWSLAVEEQFYLVWPALLSLVVFGPTFARRLSRPRPQARPVLTRRALGRLFVVITAGAVASFAWAIHSTTLTPASAYFSPFARAWELALGAALAIVAPSISRAPRVVAAACGWLGVLGICAAAIAFSDATLFPSYPTLLPTVGAALVIGAGVGDKQLGISASRVLALKPLRYVGDRSYAFYLWHWPVLIIAVQHAGHDLPVPDKLLLMVGAFMLSIVSYGVFENPLRQMRWPAPIGALLWPVSAAVVLVVAVVTLRSIDHQVDRIETAAAAVRPSGLQDPVLAPDLAKTSAKALPAVVAAVKAAQRGAALPSPLTPAVSKLLDDVYFFPDGCAPEHQNETSSKICRLGDATSTKMIVVIGDSHMQMWMPTILRMADRDNWVVVPLVKSACTPGHWLRDPKHPECTGWYRWAIAQAKALRPDVALIGGDLNPDTPVDAAVKTFAAVTTTMKRFATGVIVLEDPPQQSRQPVDCLLAPHSTMKTCSTKVTNVELSGNIRVAAGAKKRHVAFMSTRGWFCARISVKKLRYLCPLVVNRTITHRDRDHISQTYGLELASPFRSTFRRALFQ
jgi:peptidoglycan/LPS O-acetylase OafA/YrhL